MNSSDNKNKYEVLLTQVHIAAMSHPDDYGIIENGAIGINEGRIAWVGAMDALGGDPNDLSGNVIECSGVWATPGLIDCHTHLVYGGNRADEFAQKLEGKSYADISRAGGGILSTVRATRAASDEELLESAAKRLISLLREGVTTVEIKSGYGLDTANEMKMLRVARELENMFPVTVYTTFLGAHTVPEELSGNKDAYIDLICNDMLPAIAEAGLADAVDGFCESIGFSTAQMERVYEAAKRHGLLVKLHAEQLSDSGGAQLAARYQALSADHLEFVSEAGVMAMAASGTIAVLLPGAFYTLGEKCRPPVALFRVHNVPMALATDCNPGTSPCGSLLLMINMGCRLFGLTPLEALHGVTSNAALALGIYGDAGSLEVGKIADIALWDISHPAELAYHLGYNPCLGVIKHGVLRRLRE